MSALPKHSRPALGQVGDLGTFYDAQTESFLPLNLIRSDPDPRTITTTNVGSTAVSILVSDTYEEKFAKLDVNNELAGSVLAGLTPVSGSAYYLKSTRRTAKYEERAILIEITTEDVRLDLDNFGETKVATLNTCSDATHIVTGVKFGARIIIAVRRPVAEEPSQPKKRLETNLRRLHSYIYSSVVKKEDVDHVPDRLVKLHQLFGKSKFTIFWDLTDRQHIQNIGVNKVISFIDELRSVLAKEDYGRGVQLSYTLTPTNSLNHFAGLRNSQSPSIPQIPDGIFRQFIRVFEKWCQMERSINDYITGLEAMSLCSPSTKKNADIASMESWLVSVLEEILTLKSIYSRALLDVRKSNCSSKVLTEILMRCYAGKASPKTVMPALTQAKEDLSLRTTVLRQGGQYSNYNDALTAISTGSNIYVFFFTQAMKQDHECWEANRRILLNLLSRKSDYLVVVAECDPDDITFSKSRIAFYSREEVIIGDMREAQDYADQSFAKHDPKLLNHDGRPPPLERRPVNIACPSSACNNEEKEWHCYKCRQPLEYHDMRFYCDCGHAEVKSFTWQCKDQTHGSTFAPYKRNTLKHRLKQLESYKEQNILLLGETGVGKSTFINAFYNYITYRDLDDAMSHEKLEAIIPSSFTMQRIEETPAGRRFVQTDIRVGENDQYEADGTRGDSATQQTGVYRIPIGDTVYRLIDTPGVGDVRGVDADRKNLDNILQTLNRIQNLNGIIILLKPNASRLTLMFRFCIQELLTYLHRDAARNIMWGFTNTRQSNYMPGDSYKPLERLLEKHKSLGLSLSPYNVFCFDSESFRCLAAQKQGCIPTENLEDFRRSWQRSAEETHRLIQYVAQLEPHSVTSTICLNRAREVISQLTNPIAEVDDLIRRTIDLADQQRAKVTSATTHEAVLENALYYQRIDLDIQPLSQPRTICKNPSCVELKDVGGVKRPLYMSLCHDPCYLTDVTEEVIGHANLIRCAAFNSSSHCQHQKCAHHWQEHMHIRYSQEEKVVRVVDLAVEGKLKSSRTLVDAQMLAIRSLENQIQEHQEELAEIRHAALQFGVFLKRNSIAAYNDAMIAYLNEQIKEERNLVEFSQARGDPVPQNVKRLEGLKKSKSEYEVRIRLLEEQMAGSDDDEMVDEQTVNGMVARLYALPRWGKRLQRMREAVEWSRSEDFREQQFRPKVSKDVVAFLQKSAKGPGVVKSIQRVGSAFTSAVSTGLGVVRGIFSNGGTPSRGRKRGHEPLRPEGDTTRAKARRTSLEASRSQTRYDESF